MLGAFDGWVRASRAEGLRLVAVEQPVQLDLVDEVAARRGVPGLRLRGRVDRLEVDAAGRPVVVDVKTGRTAVSARARGRAPAARALPARGRARRVRHARRAGRAAGRARLVYVADQRADGQAKEPVQPPLDAEGVAHWQQVLQTCAADTSGAVFVARVGPTATAARSAPPARRTARAGACRGVRRAGARSLVRWRAAPRRIAVSRSPAAGRRFPIRAPSGTVRGTLALPLRFPPACQEGPCTASDPRTRVLLACAATAGLLVGCGSAGHDQAPDIQTLPSPVAVPLPSPSAHHARPRPLPRPSRSPPARSPAVVRPGRQRGRRCRLGAGPGFKPVGGDEFNGAALDKTSGASTTASAASATVCAARARSASPRAAW
jgi:hypothetical protein